MLPYIHYFGFTSFAFRFILICAPPPPHPPHPQHASSLFLGQRGGTLESTQKLHQACMHALMDVTAEQEGSEDGEQNDAYITQEAHCFRCNSLPLTPSM